MRNRTRLAVESDGRASVTAPRGSTVGRVRAEEGVNRITRWMMRLPRGERRGVVGGGEDPDPDPLGLGLSMAGVGDGGELSHGSMSMVLPLPLGCSEAVVWLMPEASATVEGVMPLGGPVY